MDDVPYDGGQAVIARTAQEIVNRLMAENASPGHVRDTVGFVRTITPYDPEVYKVLIVDMLREAGVQVLHSLMDETVVDGDRIVAVRLATKSGKYGIAAKQFVDTTGDADLAYLSRVP